jgi:glycosyltransferase involved in cell wall biosynthesis
MIKRKISLITVSYNSAETIRDSLVSVNNQSYQNIDHIIIDGASSDQTLNIVNEEKRRIVKVVSEPDKGIYDAYNKGLKLAEGGIIGFLNSDDIYAHDAVIERVMAEFEDPNIDAIYGDLIYVSKEDLSKKRRFWKSKDYLKDSFRTGFVPAHPTLFFRAAVYQRVGNFNTDFRYSADFDLMLRAFHLEKVKSRYINDVFVLMRDGGQTGGDFWSQVKQNQEIFRSFSINGVKFNKVSYLLGKVFNRIVQKIYAIN